MVNPIDEDQVYRRVISALEDCGVDYMLVGSFASSIHGEIRDSHDLDLVVALPSETVAVVAERLGPDYYFDVEWALREIESGEMVNLIHYESSAKIDFWFLKDEEFSRTQFARRQETAAWGIPVYVESAEDTVLSKLRWNQISPSERQITDIKGILLVQRGTLDYAYLAHWAARLGVKETLDQLLEQVSHLDET